MLKMFQSARETSVREACRCEGCCFSGRFLENPCSRCAVPDAINVCGQECALASRLPTAKNTRFWARQDVPRREKMCYSLGIGAVFGRRSCAGVAVQKLACGVLVGSCESVFSVQNDPKRPKKYDFLKILAKIILPQSWSDASRLNFRKVWKMWWQFDLGLTQPQRQCQVTKRKIRWTRSTSIQSIPTEKQFEMSMFQLPINILSLTFLVSDHLFHATFPRVKKMG